MITKVYGSSSSSVYNVKKRSAEFKRDNNNVQDDSREGRQKSGSIPEIIEKIYDITLEDWRTKVREVADAKGPKNK